MPEGVEFPFPSLLFYEGRTYGQPEVVRISLPQVAKCSVLIVAEAFTGNAPSAGKGPTLTGSTALQTAG